MQNRTYKVLYKSLKAPISSLGKVYFWTVLDYTTPIILFQFLVLQLACKFPFANNKVFGTFGFVFVKLLPEQINCFVIEEEAIATQTCIIKFKISWA
ncbi:hypothetical protein AHMF7605_16245 [Adhaeribacter arboris]|uniref:Uncharacterized protein n=1 Tax=Adhaeribacter arboris TaxID=2072846 RepID=A0A2T2YHF8_9BACT|nr:hypothetical protein AHMF7605_16245 [Adhaeribacter arboris]